MTSSKNLKLFPFGARVKSNAPKKWATSGSCQLGMSVFPSLSINKESRKRGPQTRGLQSMSVSMP